MGTYINFTQTDIMKITDTEKTLSKYKDSEGYTISLWSQEDIDIENKKVKETGSGCPDFLKLGEGQFKLSSTSDEDIAMFVAVIKEAVINNNLTINNMPGNADDYFTETQIEDIYGLKKFVSMKQKQDEEYIAYRKAREIALKTKQDELNGGVKLVESWGIQNMWLIFGNVDKPKFLQFTWEANGETHSDIYRDTNGLSYLLIPLMDMGPNGVEKVNDALDYAWNNLGLRTQPIEILAEVYSIYPSELRIGRVKLFEANYLRPDEVERGIYFDTKKSKYAYKAISITDLYLTHRETPQVRFISSSGITFAIAKKDLGAFVMQSITEPKKVKVA